MATKASNATAARGAGISILRRLGVQPTVAVVFVIVDWLLFSGEVMTGYISLLVSIMVGIVMALWAIRQQKVVYRDPLPAAVVKGVALGFLTAIPTPVFSLLTIIGGLLPILDKANKVSHDQSQRTSSKEEAGMRNVTPQKRREDGYNEDKSY